MSLYKEDLDKLKDWFDGKASFPEGDQFSAVRKWFSRPNDGIPFVIAGDHWNEVLTFLGLSESYYVIKFVDNGTYNFGNGFEVQLVEATRYPSYLEAEIKAEELTGELEILEVADKHLYV